MPLVPATLQANLLAAFNAMNNMASGGDDYMATQMATAFTTFVATGVVSTVDTGTGPGGAYAGAGAGTMAIGSCKSDLYSTFTGGGDDNAIADGIADAVDKVCAAANTVTATTTGVITTPNGPVPTTGSAKGKFAGAKAAMATALKTAFAAMKNAPSPDNTPFAAAMANAMNAYLLAGAINTTLQAPLSGAGVGKIA
jgi:hypothetical protein